jgi:hypothetical protein
VLNDSPGEALQHPSDASLTPTSSSHDIGPANSGSSLRTIGIVATGGGVVALGIGSYFGLHAKALNSDSKPGCPDNVCDEASGQKREDSKHAANASTISFLVGGALAATGVTLWVVGGSKAQAAGAATARLIPSVQHNEAGVQFFGQF